MSMPPVCRRVFLIVLDSFGIGELPDAAAYGDVGSNTLLSISRSSAFRADTLKKLGLFHIEGVSCPEGGAGPAGCLWPLYGALQGQGYHHRALGDRRIDFR